VRHRLEAGDAEALPPRGTGDDRCTRVQALEFLVRDEAACSPDASTERPVAGHDEVEAAGGFDELEHALLRRQATRVKDLRRIRLLADLGGDVDAAWNHPHVARAQLARLVRERRRRGDDDPRAAEHGAREARNTPSELEVGPPDLDDVRPAGALGNPAGREPVRVQEIGLDGARRAHEARDQRRHK
jgi:hypothetical protein